jgi:DNA repair exonuclease SbcCD ATPase subunit
MKIESLKGKSVFRYDKFTLPFDNKVYLVLGKIDNDYDGSNGAGKSALIDILLYGLYGKTLRKGITDISKDHCGEMKVRVDFDGKTIQREKNGGENAVRFFIGDEEQIGLKKELQNYISDTIDYDLFRMITIFTPKNNFFVLNDTEKKDLLITFTNNDNIDRIYEMAKKDYDELKALNVDMLIENYKNSLKQKDEIDAEFKKIEKKWDKYEKYEKGITKYQEYVRLKKPLMADKEEEEAKVERLREKGKKLKKLVADITTSDENMDKMITEMGEHKGQIDKYESKIEEIEANIKLLKDAGKCPTCRQKLTDKDKILQDYKDDISDCKQQIQINQDLLDAVKLKHMEAKDRKKADDALKMELNETKTLFDTAKASLEKTEVKIEGLKKQYEEYFEYKDADITLQEINEIKLKYVELKTKADNFAEREEELEKLKEQKIEVDKQIIDLEDIKKIFSKDGLKQFVIQQITDFLKDRINEMINQVFDDMEIDIRLDFSEKRNMMNIDIHRRDTIFNIEEMSAGERRIIEMVFQIALNDLFETVNDDSVNLMIFDETFDALDKKNMHKINNMLKILEEQDKTIFIISHNEDVKKYFKNFVIVEQNNGVSTLEVV